MIPAANIGYFTLLCDEVRILSMYSVLEQISGQAAELLETGLYNRSSPSSMSSLRNSIFRLP